MKENEDWSDDDLHDQDEQELEINDELEITPTPKSEGYRMPPEWFPHAGTLLIWPSNEETWPGERLDRVEKVYLNIIQKLTDYEPILLLVRDEAVRERVEKKLSEITFNRDRLHIRMHPVNDVWARDCGPIVLQQLHNKDPKFVLTNWGYNAWGGKYPPFDGDDAIPGYISESFEIPMFSPPMILEGGSIDVNSKGILLTTESVLLNKNRNPHLSKKEIEEQLREWLGVEKIIWLKKGLAGDDTDGHIDDLCRFVSDDTIVTALTDDPKDVNYKVLQENYEILKKARNHKGRGFEIIPMPMPKTKIEGTTVDGSEYVPASYANFYIANHCVLLPLYDPEYDDEVVALFEELFPDRAVIGIPCADLVWGQGSIHCITQQLYGINL